MNSVAHTFVLVVPMVKVFGFKDFVIMVTRAVKHKAEKQYGEQNDDDNCGA